MLKLHLVWIQYLALVHWHSWCDLQSSQEAESQMEKQRRYKTPAK